MKRCPLVVLVTLLLCPLFARADGFIVVHGAPVVPGHFTFAPLEVTFHHVTVDVRDQVAATSVDEEFYNPNGQQLEGTYIFPLPPGAHIDKFAMDVNGKTLEAELLPADKAKAIYEEIVRKAKDPALLEYVGRDAFKVRIFPIEPNGRKHVKISYTQVLTTDAGLTEYTYPLNTEKFSAKPLADVSIKVNLHCTQALRGVYSPSHNVEVRREGDKAAVVGFEDHNVRPDTDFKLIFTQDAKDVGVNLLTYRDGRGDGYFMLMASPGNAAKADAIQPKDITFVLDTSGSMTGPKIEQARKALTFCLANLNEGDRFEVVRFSSEVEPLFDKLVPATKENVDKATAFVKDLKAIGATAIDEALKKAMHYDHDKARPYAVIFLTDGLPTVGENREDAIVEHLHAWRDERHEAVRVFAFGLGTDVNTHLLDRIAGDTSAFSTYVLPEEDLEVKLSNFFTKIKEPVLSDVHVTLGGDGIKATELYPHDMPDLFKGQSLVAFGRYTGGGSGSVKVSGTLNGKPKEFSADVKFTKDDATNAFIPRLWAVRRVGWLLDEMRLHGDSKELKDEVVRLAREHGIVTPYTAFLIMEDERTRGVSDAGQNFRELRDDRAAAGTARSYYDSTQNEAKHVEARGGAQAVTNSQSLETLKSSVNAAQASTQPGLAKAMPAGEPAGYRRAQNYAQQARVLNGRAFYQNGETWTDSTIQANDKAKRVALKFDSDEYYALLSSHPAAAQWMSLGNNLDVMLDGTVYTIR